jgi:hypothetical protein
MQIFQPLEPEDFDLVKGKQPTRESVVAFCSGFSGLRRGSCWSESWPLFREDIKKTGGVDKFCAFNTDKQQLDRCYNAIFYVMTPQLEFDLVQIEDFCQGVTDAYRGQCFANAASRMIETDSRLASTSVGLCNSASKFGLGDQCWSELLTYSTYNFHRGSKEFLNLCNQLPGEWKDRCLQS